MGPGGPGPGPPGPGGPGGNNGGNGPNSSGGMINGETMEMKNSPANGPGTPRDDSSGNMGDFGMGSYASNGSNDQNESEAILKIKESMQEEAKRFEKDSDHPDYFMQ